MEQDQGSAPQIDQSEAGRDHLERAWEARRTGRLNQARTFFLQAVADCRQPEIDPGRLARSLTGLGQTERDLANRDLALQHYREAANVYRTLNDPDRLAHTVRHVADILRERGSTEEAKGCYQEALTLYRAHPGTSKLDLANTLRGFALLNEITGETAIAHLLWVEARGLYESVDVYAGVAESQAHLDGLVHD